MGESRGPRSNRRFLVRSYLQTRFNLRPDLDDRRLEIVTVSLFLLAAAFVRGVSLDRSRFGHGR